VGHGLDRPRAIGPVWKADHTWLIFCLLLMWWGLPIAFAAIMTTLYIPLGIAVFGIVLRGSGFAFREVSMRTAEQRLNGVAFASSSVITPFCFEAVAGGAASGRVPTADQAIRSPAGLIRRPSSAVCWRSHLRLPRGDPS